VSTFPSYTTITRAALPWAGAAVQGVLVTGTLMPRNMYNIHLESISDVTMQKQFQWLHKASTPLSYTTFAHVTLPLSGAAVEKDLVTETVGRPGNRNNIQLENTGVVTMHSWELILVALRALRHSLTKLCTPLPFPPSLPTIRQITPFI